MTKRRKLPHDPHADREAARYENPIPSREFILERLSASGVPRDFEEIAVDLELSRAEALEALERRLGAMARDGQLVRNRRGSYGLPQKMQLVQGRVSGHPDGYGFLVPDEGEEDLFLSPRQMRQCFHGDRVVARIIGKDRRGRLEGSVVEVLERNTRTVVGRFFSEVGVGFVRPDNKRLFHDVVIPPQLQAEAQHGQIVVAEIIEQPTHNTTPLGKVVEVLGEHMAPGMEIDIAIRAHSVPQKWPEAVLEEIAGLGEDVPEIAKQQRVDLRDTPLVTIDGEDARDFDDAVYAERRRDGGWRLWVAIADVSWYVRAGTQLDAEARTRGNSVYFPRHVIPMLPEVLSNGLCSLNPQVDRLCMVCEMTIDTAGEITRHRFYDAVMRSAARLTYEDAAAIVVEKNTKVRAKYKTVAPHVDTLYELFHALHAARARRGAIDFETTETKIIFGPERKIDQIVPVVRNDAHRLIEECMIAANICAARFLTRHKMPTLYRVHAAPPPDKLAELRQFLGGVGLKLGGGDDPTPHDYSAVLQRARARPDFSLIQTVLLRSMAQAQYAPENIGHFGLGLEHYAHFTSPIRRYPDLLVHRAIRHILAKRRAPLFEHTHEDMVRLGEHCVMTERRADEATRDAVDWLKCEYMMDKVGAEFDGLISAVTGFGLFVQLKEIYVEGLVHITALPNDYYNFDATQHCLRGERTGKVFRLADALRVKVMRVDLDTRRVDFEPAVETPVTPSFKKARRRKKK